RGKYVKVCAGIEAVPGRAIGLESRDPVAHSRAGTTAAEGSEIPCDQNPAIGLHCQLFDKPVRTRIEARIERAVGIKSPDMVAHHCYAAAAKRGEISGD